MASLLSSIDTPGSTIMMLFAADVRRKALSDVLFSWCNILDVTNLTQSSLETSSCAICAICSFLNVADSGGKC